MKKIRYVGINLLIVEKASYMWQSRVDIEHYSVVHFNLITTLEVL